jgi:hypothetical protein
MPRGKRKEDLVMLEMALIGYQQQKLKIDEKIHEIEARLKGKSSAVAAAPAKKAVGRPKGVKRVLSAAARKRIGAAQKKRWAEHRKTLEAGQA